MTLPTSSPLEFCTSYLQRILDSERLEISSSPLHWVTIERFISGRHDLDLAYQELINHFGFSDIQDGQTRHSMGLRHVFEILIYSGEYDKSAVVGARDTLKTLERLTDESSELASTLIEKLTLLESIYESSSFKKAEYISTKELLRNANQRNEHSSYFCSQLPKLDLKYWPTPIEFIEALKSYLDNLARPLHASIPSEVLSAHRASNFKDYVVAVDESVEGADYAGDFRFSDAAMANIINVVLALPSDEVRTAKDVKVIRKQSRIRKAKSFELS